MIELKGVSKSFGGARAVADLSLQIPGGQLYGLVGPNGAGKTTTLKLLCGLLHPDCGEIRIGGFDVASQRLQASQLLGYIPDMPFLYERLTAAEFYEFCGQIRSLSQEVIETRRREAFERFGLIEYADVLIRELSHGYRQRLIYAVTLLHQPRVLLIDEPFVGLDPFTIRLVKDVLREQAQRGATVLLTTHLLALIEDFVDRIGILVNGRLAREGALSELAALVTGESARLEDIFFALARE